MTKQERYFYFFLIVILTLAVSIRVSIFGVEGLLNSQTFSLGSYLDLFFLDLANDYLSLVKIANPYIVIAIVSVLAQMFVASLSSYLYFLYPQLRDVKSKEHLQGKELAQWYKEHQINLLYPMTLPFIRIAVLIGTIVTFIQPLSEQIQLIPAMGEYVVVASFYSAAIVPHLLTSKTVFWKDLTVLLHVFVGAVCLLFVPHVILLYFTANAICQAFRVLATQFMEKNDEENS